MQPPPPPEGLPENLVKLTSGGQAEDWKPLPKEKLYTNAFVWDEKNNALLLGLKKRGFGTGIYNGFGGKVEPGETPIEAALRELQEEARISAPLIPAGILLFVSEGLDFAHKIYVFRAHEYKGTPTETEEMAPEWFAIPPGLIPDSVTNSLPAKGHPNTFPSLPLQKMWADDRIWLPILFSKTYFYGRVDFGEDTIEGSTEEGEGEGKLEKWWFGKEID